MFEQLNDFIYKEEVNNFINNGDVRLEHGWENYGPHVQIALSVHKCEIQKLFLT